MPESAGKNPKCYTYRDAGVDIDKTNRMHAGLKKRIGCTHSSAVLSGLSSFSGLLGLDTTHYKNSLADSASQVWMGSPNDQPHNFMNFPDSSHLGGFEDVDFEKKYGITVSGQGYNEEYFQTYASEAPIVEINEDGEGTIIGWRKVGKRENHFFDVAVYNLAAVDVYFSIIAASYPKEWRNASPQLLLSYYAEYTREHRNQLIL